MQWNNVSTPRYELRQVVVVVYNWDEQVISATYSLKFRSERPGLLAELFL